MKRLQTLAALEALYGQPKEASLRKETLLINSEYRKLIEVAPFFTIASSGDDGLDCSPRGDGPGCIHILDERTIAFADRRGNNRLDTLRNIVSDPRVALLLMIPGLNETLRINGRAFLTDDTDLRRQFEERGTLPATVVVIEIDTMYFQCARALVRSQLWNTESQIDPKTLPSAGQLVQSVMKEFDAKEYDAALPERQAKTLY